MCVGLDVKSQNKNRAGKKGEEGDDIVIVVIVAVIVEMNGHLI